MPFPLLQTLPSLTASPAVWRERLGNKFEPFRRFLQTTPRPAGAPANSPDTTWQLNQRLLGRALSEALSLDPKTAEFPLPATAQIGSWSAEAVPVLLTIQNEQRQFRAVVAELVARLRQPFILFAPTSIHLDAACLELLAHVRAGFFPLDVHLQLNAEGRLVARTRPGELFARFRPEPKEAPGESLARKAFALVKDLDMSAAVRKAPVLTVFCLYCIDGLSVLRVAQKCHCSRTLIFSRLSLLRKKLGCDPFQLRRYSAHLDAIQQSLSDPRARRHFHDET